MLFNSLSFLYFFLPVTYFVFWALTGKTQRFVWMTITGYAFYAFWNYKFCALMAVSTAVSYFAGLGFLRWEDPRRRRLCLLAPILFDLALLAFFKYTNLALSSLNSVMELFRSPIKAPLLDIVLPVGISFYTFHTITYIVDSYRRVITPTRNFFEFSCYVSLFSQLVAGPIVRFREVEKDLERIGQSGRTAAKDRGWSFFTLGMIKKVLIADSIAAIVNPGFARYGELSTAGAWLCALGYTYQLYFDFSGYSDMAVGLGHLFSIQLPQNFNSPYKAVDIADFWRRWHISLSTVLRDYLYIPLGGNRGSSLLAYRNLMITMLLGGLWHGANWTFVIWGGYHGFLLAAERRFGRTLNLAPVVKRVATFLLVVVGWVLFRSDNFSMAKSLLHAMFSWSAGKAVAGWPLLTVLLAIAGALAHFGPNTFQLGHEWKPAATYTLAFLFAACLLAIYGGRQSPFLYFQF
jgi:alginate O-acetyltransferase complex protein AlgI